MTRHHVDLLTMTNPCAVQVAQFLEAACVWQHPQQYPHSDRRDNESLALRRSSAGADQVARLHEAKHLCFCKILKRLML